jgi:hypothetical protein
MLSVAKANVRLSGREFYADDIYNLFWNIHNQYSPNKQKVRQPKSAHRKMQTPSCRQTNLCADGYCHTINESRIFTKWIYL